MLYLLIGKMVQKAPCRYLCMQKLRALRAWKLAEGPVVFSPLTSMGVIVDKG